MSIQSYALHPGRIDELAGEIIAHAMHTEVLTPAVTNIDMPANKSNNLTVRSWVPYGGTVAAPNTFSGVTAESHITQEGVTPAADTIVPRDVNIRLLQYSALYALTDQDYDLYEDDIAAAMKEQVGERMGLVRELVVYGKMKGATNKFYSGGTSRATVDEGINERLVSNIIRSLQANHATRLTKILNPSNAYGTTSVEAAYICYVHTDAEYDIRRLPGFREVAGYGQRQVISPFELGTWQNVRFVTSPDLQPIIDSGAAVGSTGLKSTGAANIDVYPMIFLSKDAFACLKLRGRSVLEPSVILPNQKDSSDPLGQRGYIGAKFYMGAEILNPGWIAVAEVGVTALT